MSCRLVPSADPAETWAQKRGKKSLIIQTRRLYLLALIGDRWLLRSLCRRLWHPADERLMAAASHEAQKVRWVERCGPIVSQRVKIQRLKRQHLLVKDDTNGTRQVVYQGEWCHGPCW